MMTEDINENDINSLIYNCIDAIWRRRYMLCITIVIMPIFAMSIAYLLPKKYMAETSVAVYNTAPPSMKTISYSPILEDQFASVEAYITSPAVLKNVATQVGLIHAKTREKTTQNIINDLDKALTVKYVEKDVVTIKLIQNNSKNMVAILNALSALLIKQFQAPLLDATRASNSFLKHEISKQKNNLEQSISNLLSYEKNNKDFLPEYGDVYKSRLQQILSVLGDKNALQQGLFAQQEALKTSLLTINPKLSILEQAILANEEQLEKLRLVYTDNYYKIKDALTLDATLRAKRKDVIKQFKTLNDSTIQDLWDMAIVSSARSKNNQNQGLLASQLQIFQTIKLKVKGIAKEISDLTTQKQKIIHQMGEVNLRKQKWLSLNQTVQDNQKILDGLLANYMMTKGTADLNNIDQYLNLKVVSYPQNPTSSINRPLMFFFKVGIVAGFFVGLGFIALFEVLDQSVRKRQRLESATGIRVICRVEKLVTS